MSVASDVDADDTASEPVPVLDRPDNSRLRPVALVAAAVIMADQLTKWWALNELDDRVIDLVWTLRFRLIFNTGSSFGLASGFGRWLGVLIAVVLVFVIAYARRVEPVLARLLLGAIVGGAIGNLADRLFRADEGLLSGAVVDFIDLQWWPVFNVADIAVVCGAIGLMVFSMRQPDGSG